MSKKRLIDATQLKTDMYLLATLGDNENIFIDVIIDEIDNADDVDAVEVVHGHNMRDHDSAFECSVCGFEDWDTFTADNSRYNYCPNCGAKMMDGDENV